MLIHMTFERDDGVWISYIHRDRIKQLCAWYRDSILPQWCSPIICMYIQLFLVILCDTMFLKSKLIFFTFESAATYTFSYMKDASFNRNMLLKLIHFKSRNTGVTSSRFKYSPCIACHFCRKVDIFLNFICSFSLHLPHIEPQKFIWEKIRAFIMDFWSRVFLTLLMWSKVAFQGLCLEFWLLQLIRCATQQELNTVCA